MTKQLIGLTRSQGVCNTEYPPETHFNTLRPRQNGRHFADDIFKCIFVNENLWIPIKISLKFVPKGPINNIPALVQIMARRRPGDKSLSEPMMLRLPTHICVTRPQWVKFEYHEISSVYNTYFSCPIIWQFSTEQWYNAGEKVMAKRNFRRFGFKISLWQVSYMEQPSPPAVYFAVTWVVMSASMLQYFFYSQLLTW